ncbi:YbjN domain-containing protein [Hydrogenophaga defluvii]|uniref:YbjN domain-containing protein n=1 Tax=Hydrogenophaga defluvii TaxID=249410 RepID=A0ABW2SBB7_9BURK
MKEHYTMPNNITSLSSELIEEQDISIVNLSLLLEQSVIQHTIQEEDKIYVTEPGVFAHWIRIFREPCIIALSTYFTLPEGMNDVEKLEFCNKINAEYLVPSAYTKDDRVWLFNPIYFKSGLIKSHLVRQIRYFASGCQKVRRELKSNIDGKAE